MLFCKYILARSTFLVRTSSFFMCRCAILHCCDAYYVTVQNGYGEGIALTKWKTVEPVQAERTKTRRVGKRHTGLKAAIAAVLLAAAAVAAVFWALPYLPQQPQVHNSAAYKGVVELWNVESFEGGVGSREGWLTGRAAQFEKANKGLFVHITTLSMQQLQEKLQQGEVFDMICFSRGAGAVVQQMLAPLECSVGEVMNNMLLSGQIKGVQYALPVYAGVYCLFARCEMLPAEELVQKALSQRFTRKVGKSTVELKPLVCGFTSFNSPLTALALAGVHGQVSSVHTATQYEAYELFTDNRTAVSLLGTQRDIYRLSRREEQGRIDKLGFAPLGAYTDLVQYVAVGMGDNAESCRRFAEYLVGKDAQASLVDVGMFPVLDTALYTAERYALCAQQLPTAYVPNVFGDEAAVERQRQMAQQTLEM